MKHVRYNCKKKLKQEASGTLFTSILTYQFSQTGNVVTTKGFWPCDGSLLSSIKISDFSLFFGKCIKNIIIYEVMKGYSTTKDRFLAAVKLKTAFFTDSRPQVAASVHPDCVTCRRMLGSASSCHVCSLGEGIMPEGSK